MKKVFLLLLLIISTFIFSGCVNSKSYLKVGAYEKINVTYEDRRNEGYVDFLNKLGEFSSSLTYNVYEDYKEKDNLTISPISIYMGLALAVETTNGNSREEMLNALGMTYEEVATFTKYLYAFCNMEYTYNASMITERRKVSAFELLTNSIWVDNKVSLKEEALEKLASNYNCNSYQVPFSTKPSTANGAIKDFVSDNTNGLINREFDFDNETMFVLLNTFYLKEIWNEFGNELKFTKNQYDFLFENGTTKSLELLMGKYNDGKAYEEESFRHFFTTTEHNFKIKFIVPKNGYKLEDVFTFENIMKVNTMKDYLYDDVINKEYNHTRVFFPEFKGKFDGDLKTILEEKYSVKSMFNIKTSDFTSISDSPAFFTGMVHQTELEVNRKGIEGSAITAFPGAGAPGPNEEYVDVYYDFIVDKSFGFILTDSYNTILFSGVINNI